MSNESKTNKEFKLPFGIEFVVNQDLSVLKTYKASNHSFNMDCPFCGGKRKFNVNTMKNLARCNKCGGQSGYNTITLHAALTRLNPSESYKDLMNRWNGLSSSAQVVFQNNADAHKDTGSVPADIAVRDSVYRALLEKLSLSEAHKQDLLNRGLSEEQIKKGMYKTVPAIGMHSLAYEAVRKTNAFAMLEQNSNWGIPGFTDVQNLEKIALRGRKNGYFIPVLTKEGKISGMQIRYDKLSDTASEEEKERYKKYSWYSSSDKNTGCGVTGCENIHYAGDFSVQMDEVNLTEGVLKSDVAAALSGKNFIGLVGVNNISQLEKNLFNLQYFNKLKNVNLFIDMDYREKNEVAAALLSIKRIINSVGEHNFTFVSSTVEGAYVKVRTYKAEGTPLKELVIGFKQNLPKQIILFAEKVRIPASEFRLQGNCIIIGYDYAKKLRNKTITLHISDATKPEYAKYNSLTTDEKRNLIKSSHFADVSFLKTGLTYKEINWNEKYKGIDDFYFYLRSIGAEIK